LPAGAKITGDKKKGMHGEDRKLPVLPLERWAIGVVGVLLPGWGL